MRALDLDAKVAGSGAVVHGVVEALSPHRSGPNGPIGTTIRVRVIEAFRGAFAPGDRFALERAGGTLEGVTEWIPGLHRYAVGDEVVVLAERSATGWVAVGVGIGTYVIERASGCPTGAPGCGRVRFAPAVVQAGPDGELEPVPASEKSWPAFRARLRTLADAPPFAPRPRSAPTFETP